MKRLPLGMQSFREIVTGDYVYVDKTRYVYNLINGVKHYFLSRPRRFGKSLLLDTLCEAFNGEKELFNGLWIYGSDYAFEKYPVIRLDMSNIANKAPEVLEDALMRALRVRIEEEGFSVDDGIPSHMFKRLIELLHKKYGRQVAVLIDEYDKPILDHLHNTDAAERNRQVIRGFYGILKSMDPHIRFTFVTGVSKFTKTSIFSELNNLKDITLTEKYAGICGIALKDLDGYFGEHISNLQKLSSFRHFSSVHDDILAWYDGYSWDGENRLINPFSLLSFFEQEKFESFWYSSGSPKFLIDLIKTKPESFLALKNLKVTERLLDSFDIHRMDIEPLLFQTGYLTVREVLQTKGAPIYALDIPNFEVRDAFNMQVFSTLTESGDAHAERAQIEMRDALADGDLQRMLDILRGLFASIPYELHVKKEACYHSIFYAVMTVLGFDMSVEVSVSGGRVDAVLELDDKVYVMEFKYEDCPVSTSAEDKRKLFDSALAEAMTQLNDRSYHKRFLGSGKTIYQAAFAFLGRDDIEMSVDKICPS